MEIGERVANVFGVEDVDNRLRIKLKRVDILNCDAALPSIQLFL